ncbi:MAG: hypothetical protein RLZ44_1304 [Pseudomonadota bacterium]
MRELPQSANRAVILARLHHNPDLPRLAAVLVLVVLAQVLLPLQSHTRVVRTTDGIARQICTWDGTRTTDPERSERDSPAMLFSQLAAELLPGITAPPPLLGGGASTLPLAEQPGAAPLSAAVVFRSRAPPVA